MSPEYGARLFDHHQRFLADRAVNEQVAKARGYSSTVMPGWLRQQGFSHAAAKQTPGLVIPVHDVHGDIAFYQYRPDTPRLRDGKPAKYERPTRVRGVVDVPPSVRANLDDPSVPLWITESPVKADALVSAGQVAVGILGVWGWRGTNSKGGKTLLGCFDWVALNGRLIYLTPDSDVLTNDRVDLAVHRLGRALSGRGADVRYVVIPSSNGRKVGVDDYLAAGGSWQDLARLADEEPPAQSAAGKSAKEEEKRPAPAIDPVTLAEAVKVFQTWLHLDDADPLYAVAAAVVGNLAPGDPVWLLVLSPPSTGKTELLNGLAPLPYVHSAAAMTEPSLLSGSSRRDRGRAATGELLDELARLVGGEDACRLVGEADEDRGRGRAGGHARPPWCDCRSPMS